MSYNNPEGWNIGPNDGGVFYSALAYLLGWKGPINETDDPYDDHSTNSTKGVPVVQVQDIAFILYV